MREIVTPLAGLRSPIGAVGGSLARYALGGERPALVVNPARRAYYSADTGWAADFTGIGTFERAGSATELQADGSYVTRGTDVAVIQRPITGGLVGLAVEDGHTNLAVSRASVANWPNGSLSLSDGADGLVIPSAGAVGNTVPFASAVSVTSGTAYHVAVKYFEGTSGRLRVAVIELATNDTSLVTGAAGSPSVASEAAGTITDLTDRETLDGGRLVEFVWTPDFTGNAQARFGPDTATSGNTVIAEWGYFSDKPLQSPTLANTAPSARARDTATINMFHNAAFSVGIDFTISRVPTDGFPRIVELYRELTGDDDRQVLLINGGTGGLRLDSFEDAVDRGSVNIGSISAGRNRVVFTVENDRMAASLNGGAEVEITSVIGSVPALGRVRFFASNFGGSVPGGQNLVHEFVFWPSPQEAAAAQSWSALP